MNHYTEQLKAYLAAHKPDFGCGDVESMVEMLFLHYAEHNPMDNQRIKELFRAFDARFAHWDIREFDTVSDLVCGLCFEHQRCAFIEGLRAGAGLAMELGQGQPKFSTNRT